MRGPVDLGDDRPASSFSAGPPRPAWQGGPVLSRPLVTVLLAALAGTTAGCDGGSEPDPAPTSSAAPDAVREGVARLYAADETGAEQLAEADCFADALLDRLDVDALSEAGVVGDDGAVVPVLPVLDVPTAEAWVAAQGDCADFVEVSTRAIVAQSKGRADPTAYAACLRRAMAPDAIDAALVDTLTGRFDSERVAALSAAQAGCSRSAQPSD